MDHTFNEFAFEIRGGHLIGAKHIDYDTEVYMVRDNYKETILKAIQRYVDGTESKCLIWSDYDHEEPSDDGYVKVHVDGTLIPWFLELEDLIDALRDEDYVVYLIRVEDNLL